MFRKLATSLGLSSPDPPPASVIAQMGRKTFKVEFEPDDYDNEEKGASVGFLRNKIGEATNTPSSQVTLVHGGRKLIDDKQYLVDCGVLTDAKILVIASKQKRPKIKQQQQPPPKPKSGRERVQEVVDHVDKQLRDLVEKFEQKPAGELSLEKTKEEHHKLSELVLQKMFALDDVDVSEDSELRLFRKDTINSMHSLHKRVDDAFEKKKEELLSSNGDKPSGEEQSLKKEEDPSSKDEEEKGTSGETDIRDTQADTSK